ncbi:hypothetical protein WG947_07270 [Pontibacter sp. H259]|uniref:hypothetical protein n=1 Tax=Pontibacter sp. H259 TaxID=3133421 RepID=UPI0030C52A02
MKYVLPIAVFILICLTGCNSINTSRRSTGISRQSLFLDKDNNPQTTLMWAHYDATQRGGLYLITKEGLIKVISEPPPDAGVNNMLDIIAKTKIKGDIDAGIKLSTVRSVAELGKKNASNYIIRDITFRIETLLNNNTEISPEALSLYMELLSSTKEIALAETNLESSRAKVEMLKELNALITKSQDPNFVALKLDSTFFKNLNKQISN